MMKLSMIFCFLIHGTCQCNSFLYILMNFEIKELLVFSKISNKLSTSTIIKYHVSPSFFENSS